MHKKLQVSKYTAIKQLLYSKILTATSVYTCKEKALYREYDKVSLYKRRDKNRILYISGVALSLSKSQNCHPMEITRAIASHLSANCDDEFNLEIVPPGYIYLVVSDRILAVWLQSLVDQSRGWGDNLGMGQDLIPDSSRLFGVQYAHARCCSLLRLAGLEGLIQFREPNKQNNPANTINWLHGSQLRFEQEASWNLISQLLQVVDDLECPNCAGSVNWEKAALRLSQAWETFFSKCRIWGEVKIATPELANARLGLVMATQSVLRFLLEEKFGVFAQIEL